MTLEFKSSRMLMMLGAAALVLAACSNDEPTSAQEGEMSDEQSAEAIAPAGEFPTTVNNHAIRYLKESPELATSLGVSEQTAGENFNARFSRYGYPGNYYAEQMNERFLEQMRRYRRDDLPQANRITYDVLLHGYEMAAQRNSFDFGNSTVAGSSGPYVINQLVGPHISLPQLMLTEHPLESADDVEAYLARLAQFGEVFTAVSEALMADANAGVVPPAFALEKIGLSIDSFTAPGVADNLLVTHLADSVVEIDGMDDEARSGAVDEATRLVEETVYPAYSMLGDTVSELIAQSNDDAGIWRIERGEDFYQHALNSFGADGRTAEEIHQIGLDEVARIEGEMDEILTGMGLTDGGVGERFASIADDPENVYPNTDDGKEVLLEELRAQVEAINEMAPDWFGTLPPQDVEVRRIPVYEQDSAPGGYYTGPSLDGSRPGIYWINLKDTADWPKHTLKTLTYHEAVPGHHFQIALQYDIDDFPLMRNTFFYSQYSEGWALYAEQVAAEMGMYDDDPLGDLGRLQSELFRAVRLVVDTGLHDKQWTREEAIDYMVEHLGDTEASVTREVERYSVWPGQATSYKLGMLKIQELRAEAEAALGEDFDIRAFHDAILLDGAMPLPVLEAKIDRWVEEQQEG